MLYLEERIQTISNLVEENTAQSLTYAALECRLTIEEICYERLRSAHDYISHDDIKKWQPKDIVMTLIQEVDRAINQDVTISIGKKDAEHYNANPNEEIEYQLLGKQIGFNAKKLGRFWNALSNVALHVTIPKTKEDRVVHYGKKEKILGKVNQCISEFRRLSATTMIFDGVGENVEFKCTKCDTLNKKRVSTLDEKRIFSCINARCIEKYRAEINDDAYRFERIRACLNCECGWTLSMSLAKVEKLKIGEAGVRIVCSNCDKSYNLDAAIRARLEHNIDT